MKNAWKLVEAEAYEQARKQPLTKKHGKPTRSDYIVWCKALEIVAASYDVSDTYDWTVDAAGNNFGCLALVVDPMDAYEIRTSITTYVAPTEPPHYDATINADTPTFQRKQLEEENEQKKHDYFEEDVIKGILEREQWEDENKPLEIFSESLKGYIKDVETLQ